MASDATQRAKSISDLLASMNILSSAINDRLARQLHAETGSELTISQYKLLKLVAYTEAERISDVAAFLGITTPAASKAVSRLVGLGLLTRTVATDDRRVSRLALTAEGQGLLHRHEKIHNRMLEQLFNQHLPESLEETAEVLDRLSIEVLKQGATPVELCFRCGVYFRDKCLVRDIDHHDCSCHLHHVTPDNGEEPTGGSHEGGADNGQAGNQD